MTNGSTLQYRSQLEPRSANWDNEVHGVWPGRKLGPYKWYEIQDNIAYYKDFEKPKILYPVIAVNNRFTLDISDHYANDKTFLIPTDDLYLLAILNSSTLFLFFRTNLSLLRGGFLEYREQTLIHTPIRRINFTAFPAERDRCFDKAKLLYQQCISKNDQDCVLGFVNHHLAKEPEESDVVHDLLAFLAEEMLRLNKEKRALQKEFLDYFVDAVQVKSENGKVGVEVLTGKSKLLEFAGDYQKGEESLAPAALWEIVQKNRSKLNAGRVGLKERVLEKYQEKLELVLPLKEQLQRTDALIDQVVYRLYGLTEEEIAIVEGRP